MHIYKMSLLVDRSVPLYLLSFHIPNLKTPRAAATEFNEFILPTFSQHA